MMPLVPITARPHIPHRLQRSLLAVCPDCRSTPNIWLLDEANRIFADDFSPHRLAIRCCLERLTVVRNRLLDAKYTAA